MKLELLWTDIFYITYLIIIGAVFYYLVRKQRTRWALALSSPLKIAALTFTVLYAGVGFLDSIHFREALSGSFDNKKDYSQHLVSVLDIVLQDRAKYFEKTYSEPFATELFVPDIKDGKWVYEKLKHVSPFESDMASMFSLFLKYALPLLMVLFAAHYFLSKESFKFLAIPIIIIYSFVLLFVLASNYHILGTDKIGKDVFYISLKGVRTGILIGTLTTSIIVPIALILGVMAGFFRGVVDDVIQYIYSTISSIPGVLLIAASVLSLQLWIEKHQNLFQGYDNRVELRLLLICVVLGVTGWPGLCRLLRAETLKIRELSYIDAARVLNTSPFNIISKHILPNVLYLVLISTVMDLSGLVLAESVLSYVGVGVDPSSYSWGNMINGARLELARTPVVWWSLFGAFSCMFIFVVSINILADMIRDIYDPRTVVK